jgi:hypothetical protein
LRGQIVSRPGGFVPGLGFIKLLARDDAGFQKALRAPVFLFGVGQVGGRLLDFGGLAHVFQFAFVFAQTQPRPRLHERRLLLIDGKLQFDRGDARQRLSFAHTVADVGHDLFDAAFGFRTDSDFIVREKRADRLHHTALLSLFGRGDSDLRFRLSAAWLSVLGFSRFVARAG